MTAFRLLTILPMCGLMACGSEPQATARRHEVSMEGMAFVPADLTVNLGDTVVWINRDIVQHTATDPINHPGAWDTGTVVAGDSGVVVMTSRGTMEYTCTFHPVMTGKIVVE